VIKSGIKIILNLQGLVMKSMSRAAVLIILTGCVSFVSCKKEKSCEGCTDNKNKPPVAVAGPNQLITLPTDSISLDGNASSDPDGKISEWLWTKISGPVSFIIVKPSDSATKVKSLVAGTYQFELKVTDNAGLSAKDTMQVIVDAVLTTNHPPIANAGTDTTITLPANTINLDGSRSTDPENSITSYAWTKISGPSSFNISNVNVVQTQVTNLVSGIYQFELKVTDAGGLFSKDTMQVTVNPESPPPPSNCDPGTRPLVPAQLIPIGTLSSTRSGYATAAAGNKILFAGGGVPSGYCATSRVDIYDISANSWTTAELSEARHGMGVAALGNKIFFGGGFTPKNFTNSTTCYISSDPSETRSSTVDIYDVFTNIWSTAQLSSRRAPVSASAANKVVFAGGDDMIGSDRVDIYDASTNSWTTTTLSDGKHISQIAVSGTKIFLAGGSVGIYGVGGNSISGRIDIFDAASNTWTTDALNRERGQMGAISVNNKIYWGGGVVISTDPTIEYMITNSVEIRDLATNTTTFDCLSEPKAELTAVRKDNKIIFFGGFNNTRFDIYDITAYAWSIGVLGQDIVGAAIISFDNTIYVAGGLVNGVLSNQVWKLEF